MSTKPPISSLGSAPLMNFSSPAASTPLIQSRRSLLAMFSLHYPDDWAIGFFHYRALKFGTFSPDAFELDIGLIRGVEHQSIWMPTDPKRRPTSQPRWHKARVGGLTRIRNMLAVHNNSHLRSSSRSSRHLLDWLA